MQFLPIKTRVFQPPKDNIYNLLDNYLPVLKDKDIVLIASKLLCIHSGSCIRKDKVKSKDALIRKEAEKYIPRGSCPDKAVILTIKNNTIVASAGIDESNADNHYLFWPKDLHRLTKDIYFWLKKKYSLKRLGLIITDSHCLPLRYGTVGISISFFGFKPIKDYVGNTDIFGRKFEMEKSNLVDNLASAAVLFMGEGDEKKPIVIARNIPSIKFSGKNFYKDFIIDPEKDIYFPLLKIFKR